MQKQQATAAVGFSIEGEAQGSKRRWPQAASAFQSALQRSGDAQDAIGLHLALLSGGQDAEARRVISEWEKAHPTDLNVPTYVALSALARGDCDQAAPLLRKIVAQQPNDASTVNNLAWCATRQGDPAAVQLAERANALLPNNASILDTLASALAAQKQFAKAIEIEQKALELSPDGHALRLNFARILLQSGDKARAKVELEKLAYLGQKFDGQSEVTELMRKAR